MHDRRIFVAAILCAGLAQLVAALPAQARTPSGICVEAASLAARESGVPYEVLLALTLTETGRSGAGGALEPWAWTLNQGGEGYWLNSRDEALDRLEEILAGGVTNVDVGCFQLNYRWHSDAFPSLDAMIDPAQNARYAAELIRRHYQKNGDWALAAAAYHSGTPEYAERYLARFQPILASLDMSAVVAPAPEAARDNRFPLLQAGAIGGAGSLVPLSGAGRPLFGG